MSRAPKRGDVVRAKRDLGENFLGLAPKVRAGTLGVVVDVGFFGGVDVRFDTGHIIQTRAAHVETTTPSRGWFG